MSWLAQDHQCCPSWSCILRQYAPQEYWGKVALVGGLVLFLQWNQLYGKFFMNIVIFDISSRANTLYLPLNVAGWGISLWSLGGLHQGPSLLVRSDLHDLISSPQVRHLPKLLVSFEVIEQSTSAPWAWSRLRLACTGWRWGWRTGTWNNAW